MGSSRSDGFHARKENALVKLVKGRESAFQLQTILHQPVQDLEPVSVQQLALQIFRSFSDSLSDLSSDSDQIPAVDCGGSACSVESRKKRGVKDRRGCYKRRRTSDSWVTVSPTMEDGCAWRKYGQKAILNSEHPRCYFRCTHKNDGCKALKQVQRVQGSGQVLYQTTYLNHHSCKETLRAPPLLVESEPGDPNLISFETRKDDDEEDDEEACIINNTYSSKPSLIPSSVKQEDHSMSTDDARSTLEDQWHDQLDPLPFWPPFQDEVESSLDMEVNQISDIMNFHYFD